MKRYENIDAFYAENEERRNSGEADYGVWWTEANRNWPRWRVSYIKKTGEIYAVQMNEGQVELLGVVPPDDAPIYYQTLDRILEGWADIIHELGSLDWLRAKLRK